MALVEAKRWTWGGCSNSSLARRSSALLRVFVGDWLNETANGTKRYPFGGDFFASYPLVATFDLLTANKWPFSEWSAAETDAPHT